MQGGPLASLDLGLFSAFPTGSTSYSHTLEMQVSRCELSTHLASATIRAGISHERIAFRLGFRGRKCVDKSHRRPLVEIRSVTHLITIAPTQSTYTHNKQTIQDAQTTAILDKETTYNIASPHKPSYYILLNNHTPQPLLLQWCRLTSESSWLVAGRLA
jgi:hypothetical protein